MQRTQQPAPRCCMTVGRRGRERQSKDDKSHGAPRIARYTPATLLMEHLLHGGRGSVTLVAAHASSRSARRRTWTVVPQLASGRRRPRCRQRRTIRSATFRRTSGRFFKHAVPDDLSGQSVLDIGCNGGFYSFEMKRRGARRVVGVDHDPRTCARPSSPPPSSDWTSSSSWATSTTSIAWSAANSFDYVVFMGVLYHLRHPLYRAWKRSPAWCAGGCSSNRWSAGAWETMSTAPDYPIAERESSSTSASRACTSSSMRTLAIRRTGGSPIHRVRRRCCERRAAASSISRATRCTCASRRAAPRDRGGHALERTEQPVALGSHARS